jgi:hypothetical protein
MGHTLKLEIPDELYEPLLQKAKATGQTLEELLTEWLSTAVQRLNNDPLLQLAGVFEAQVTDLSERHDSYIGQELAEELRGGQKS